MWSHKTIFNHRRSFNRKPQHKITHISQIFLYKSKEPTIFVLKLSCLKSFTLLGNDTWYDKIFSSIDIQNVMFSLSLSLNIIADLTHMFIYVTKKKIKKCFCRIVSCYTMLCRIVICRIMCINFKTPGPLLNYMTSEMRNNIY